LKKRTDLNNENKDLEVPLIYVCKVGYGNIVNLLIKNVTNINKENKDGDAPLIFVCMYKRIWKYTYNISM